MLRVYINDQELSLGEDFSIELHVTNAFFAEEGNHTYDIDVDLRVPSNAKIFPPEDRLNVVGSGLDFKAKVMDGANCLMTGYAVMLSVERYLLKIQIVDTSSEGADFTRGLTMRQLDLGEFTNVTKQWALRSLSFSDDYDGVCCPVKLAGVYNGYPTTPGQSDVFANLVKKGVTDTSLSEFYEGGTSLIVQPRFVSVIDRVFKAFGWTVRYNVLRDYPPTRRMIVVHGFQTNRINEMLPDWKVSDFLKEVERFFNVMFVYNSITHTVDIDWMPSTLNRSGKLTEVPDGVVLGMTDTPKKTFDSSEPFMHDYDGIKYDLPKEIFYKMADLSDAVLKSMELVEYNSFDEMVAAYKNGSLSYKQTRVATFKGAYNLFIPVQRDGESFFHTGLAIVDDISHIAPSSDDSYAQSFNICPAEVVPMEMRFNEGYINAAYIPYARNQGKVSVDPPSGGISEWIKDGVPEVRDSSKDKLFLAYYVGWERVVYTLRTQGENPHYAYPQCQVTPYILYNSELYVGGGNTDFSMRYEPLMYDFQGKDGFELYDMGLKFRKEHVYSAGMDADLSEKYEIDLLTDGNYDVRSIFLIHGRKFYCKELVYKYEHGLRLPYVTGTFFALKS